MLTNIRKAPAEEAGDQDRLMALLAYIIGIIVPLIILLTDMKNRPFQKYHAVQALIADVALILLVFVLGLIPIIGCITPLLSLAALVLFIYWGIQAYQGNYFEIPMVTAFARQQGWLPQ
ncbi:MAG: DUF4870 domain-containing protein [Anaerolineae bacterium]|uniref:DUF4870 domain-containing protein n=1 Tax=Thermoflexus sp. TaxID=1969742 RepID=UPI0025E1A1FD|nr:DUF4870 domain-containing protein [Thermoflexus sp.]MCS7350848.1 DUF4870 domain-containing protein [Thermoflexus sp.]MDW8180299.1 DUF4870 domain-containing protein [Anaerolineae bacterium]